MRHAPLRAALAAFAFLALLAPAASRAQEPYAFAVGVGGSLVNDTGTAAKIRSFGTAGAHLFGEMTFERWGVMQLRLSRFGLPGTQPDAPNLRADAATLTVGYKFREEWWSVLFYAGGGGYRLEPRDLEEGQVAVDDKETVVGWTGGIASIFTLAPRWDLRLEVAGHYLRTDVPHKPIFITGGLAYHF